VKVIDHDAKVLRPERTTAMRHIRFQTDVCRQVGQRGTSPATRRDPAATIGPFSTAGQSRLAI